MAVCIEERICKGCGICVNSCPQKILKISDRKNSKGSIVVEIIDAEECISCGICEMNCPDLAIYLYNLFDTTGSDGP